MKKIFILTISTVLFYMSSSQASVCDSIKFNKSQKPITFSLNAGTSFMTGFNHGSAFSTFVAPQFNYPLSKRFILNAGFAVVNTSFNSKFSGMNDNQKKSFNSNYISTFIYAGGKYLLNDRFILSGQAYTEVNTFNPNDKQQKLLNNNIKGAILGIDYKITENSTIGIHMNFSNGNTFYNSNPYSMPGQNTYGIPGQNPFYNH